ncbi:type II toxin-antitoxin system Rv0910 family toxin [Actinoplanes awajinensis]|uniref:Enoyl-CoA hydratase n=1 Tax=Actinoplanes awajinensis subsp. mycoplanecinus TaxID=135947 RepID=A0A101JLR9_9ACTN|nr:enoyl-CoA hydratase-related protein [Actinoplanes awajinensis]KUL29219.1 enoyl-CoA hydratase [Actinoplanes awajinensis subsp. mycoplanecinus]
MRLRRRSVPAAPPAVPPPRVLARPWALSVAVAAPVERVFGYLATPARMADWLVMHTGWPAEPPPVLSAGVRFAERVKLMGTPVEVRWTVAGADGPRYLWLDGTGPMGIEVGVYLSLEAGPGGAGALVRLDGGVQGGPTAGPLGPMVARSLADALRSSLRRLAAADLPAAAAPAPPGARKKREKSGKIRHERSGRDLDPWTPVIVGVGQVSDHTTDVRNGDPVSLAVRALHLAAQDSAAASAPESGAARSSGADGGAGRGSADLLKNADTVGWVASVSWQYPDGGALIAAQVGAAPQTTVQTGLFGGDGPLRLINDLAAAITRGETTIALIAGAEAAATAAAAERAGRPLGWPTQPDGTAPSRTLGADREPNNAAETAAGLISPLHVYALIESALRARLGLSQSDHLKRITGLWARFAEVAATNPYAWLRQPRTATELATPDGGNRPVCAPYTKLLTANLQVNQAAGLIMCSAEAARDAGVPQDRWIFPYAGAHAADTWFVTERADLTTSPALHAVGTAVLAHTGRTIGDVRHLDLYACFPSAVQIAAAELGLPIDDPDRPLTVTGGLTFAGGPGNNYASHAVATLVPRLRADPDGIGLATAVGWYLTKHAATVFSASPPDRPFRDVNAGLRLHRPTRAVRTGGAGVREAGTVVYRRDGEPEAGIVTEILDDGSRVVRRVDPAGDVQPEGKPLPPPGEPAVLVEWRGPVTVIRLRATATAEALHHAVEDFDADPDAKVAVLAGPAPAGTITFAAGKPLIAAVEAADGGGAGLAADLIVAAEDALIGVPESDADDAGSGLRRLAGLLPRALAMELLLTGDPIPARRLHDLGLINRITPAGTAYRTALDLAASIAAHPAEALLRAHRTVDDLRRKA